jgi:xanthine dehydrogenase YagS FAD-binding subunit
MAMIRDMMPTFDLFQPGTISDAVALLDRHGSNAWTLGGGLDSFEWLKERIRRPAVVVDLGSISELRGVRTTGDGIEVGAMTTLTEVIGDDAVTAGYDLLSTAAVAVATPQIRNQGTLGGNLAQDARCWYYRGGWPCYRAGGNICYADTPTSINREHALFGADRCVAVNPSDTAPALVALDAKMVINNASGERVVDAEDFFVGPGANITQMTVLEPSDLLTSIRIPTEWAGTQFYFEKARDRQAWDFPLVNIASAMEVSGGVIQRARIVVNAVSCVPMRLRSVEQQIVGEQVSEELAEAAGEVAIQGARPLVHNRYKIPLMRNLVKRAIRNGQA